MFAKILKILAVIAVLTFPLAIIATRMDLIDFRTAFDFITWSVFLAIALFLAGTIIGFAKANSAPELARAARFASLLSLIPILILGNQLYKVRSLPAIHNISTDLVDPPAFVQVPELRGEGTNPLAYDPEQAPVQQAAYPEVKSFVTDRSVSEMYARALEVAREFGWEIVSQDPDAGIIEATESTLLWGFKDDVVIRIRAQDGKTIVDLRSVSRVGQSDIGANAKRIKRFLAEL